jgi:hypothetical protein
MEKGGALITKLEYAQIAGIPIAKSRELSGRLRVTSQIEQNPGIR